MPQRINTNEREFQGDVLKWMREVLSPPFTEVTQETTVEGLFPDAILWKDRGANVAIATCELKTLDTSPRDSELLTTGNRKARDLNAQILITWNMADAVVWRVGRTNPQPLWSYPSIDVPETRKWRDRANELRNLAHSIVIDVGQFLRDGTPPQKGTPESTVFIEGIHRTVETLVPLYQGLMLAAQREVLLWCARQGIPSDDDFDTAARHAVYRIIGKLLFYQTLARTRGDLPSITVPQSHDAAQFQNLLREYFRKARQIDYQAIFDEHLPDTLPFSSDVAERLRTFCHSFLALNLPRMTEDVIGRIFESLVPGDDKKRLGQYFTEPWLADLIVCSAVRSKSDVVFDPTCGTGGILLRAYEYLKTLGVTNHSDLLDQVWGNDIGDFPTELAMINLFRQNVLDLANFPRIFTRDIFSIAPGDTVEAPPLHSRGGVSKMVLTIPQFDAVIGNPPYLKWQRIGAGTPNPERYKQQLWQRFPELSHLSDLFSFVFEKGNEFVRVGGRLCFVTSNAWLDSEYGTDLQRAFLQHTKIIAIYESRCEPWFENADINTVVTLLEKPPPRTLRADGFLPDELAQHEVAFVTFKRPLQAIIDLPLDDPRRYQKYARLVADIEVKPDGFENADIRIRKVTQGELLQKLPLHDAANISKWSIYLRAPRAFIALMGSQKLVPLSDVIDTAFGTLTGANKFYCPRPNNPGYPLFEKVHQDYRIPILRSMRDADDYELGPAHAEGELFVCNDPPARVRGKGTQEYIRWGSTQRGQDGRPLPQSGEMANRDPWYSTRDPVRGDLCFQMFIGGRHACPVNPKRFAVLNNMLAGDARQAKHKNVARCILNSSWFALCNELYGKTHLGGGALKIDKVDLDQMPLPRFDLFKQPAIKKMDAALKSMRQRKVLPIREEMDQKDRKALDAVVFHALGLTNAEGDEIRKAVVQLAEDRERLSELQDLRSSARVTRDVKIVVDDIINAVMPEGFKKFPDDFAHPKAGWLELPVPASGLAIKSAPSSPGQSDMFLGDALYEIVGDGDYEQNVSHPEQVAYLYLAQDGSPKFIKVPTDRQTARTIIESFTKYVRETKDAIEEAVYQRIVDGTRADAVASQIMEQCNLRELPVPVKKMKRQKKS